MLFVMGIEEDSFLLHQKAFTPTEVKEVLEKCRGSTFRPASNQPTTSPQDQSSQPSQPLATTNDECERIFQKHPLNKHIQQWKLCVFKRRNPVCAGCHKVTITENSLQIVVNGLYIPQNTRFCVTRTYHFCVNHNCISSKPPGSNLTPPTTVKVDGTGVRVADVEQAIAAGIPIE